MITGNEPAMPSHEAMEGKYPAVDARNRVSGGGLTILQHATIEMAKAIVTAISSSPEMAKIIMKDADKKGLSVEDCIAESALSQAQSIIKVLNQ